MTFDAARVDCVGEACSSRVAPAPLPLEPLSAATPETVSLKGAGVMVEGLLPALIKGYAAGLGAVVTPIVGTTPTETKLRLSDTKGAELATFVIQRDSATAGVSALTQGAAEIALLDRPMTEQETQALARLPGKQSAKREPRRLRWPRDHRFAGQSDARAFGRCDSAHLLPDGSQAGSTSASPDRVSTSTRTAPTARPSPR